MAKYLIVDAKHFAKVAVAQSDRSDRSNVDIRERHIGRISSRLEDGQSVEVDVGLLVRRLLLFEHCTIQSDLLKEIPDLIRVFGMSGLKTLLGSGAVSIICDAATMASIGQIGFLKVSAARGGPLPLGSYRIVPIKIADRDKYRHEALQSVHNAQGISFKQQVKLKKSLVPLLGEYPIDAGSSARFSFTELMHRSDPTIRRALAAAFRSTKDAELPEEVSIAVEDLGNDGDFRVETNLAAQTGLSDEEVHKVVEHGLLGVADVEFRLQIMKEFDSLSGFQDDEFPVFEQRLSWLGEQLDPGVQERRFERVVAVAGLPGLEDLPAGQHIDIDRLLSLRDSDECREFRRWLRAIDSETDREIEERFASLREKLSSITHTKAARTVRFAVESGLGAVPVVGSIVGPSLTLLDTYLVEKVIGKPGPVAILSKKYPSIFGDITVSLDELLGGVTTPEETGN